MLRVRILPGDRHYARARSSLRRSTQITAVIFDCDGVLVDSEPLHYQAFQQVLLPLGLAHDYQDYVQHYIGFDDRDAFVEVFKNAERPLGDNELTDLITAKDRALQQIVAKGVTSFPGVVAFVKELIAYGLPLAVASGSLRHEVDKFLEALGLAAAFPVRVTASDVKHSKPDPETYLLALQRLVDSFALTDVEPRSCVAIEDTPTGIQSAKGAGLFTIAVAHSYPNEQLLDADHVLKSFESFNVTQMIQIMDR